MCKKVIVAFIGILLVGCVLTVISISNFWQRLTDPTNVNTVAHSIADFDLPSGYQPDYVIEALGYTVAAYNSTDEQSHLVFMQTPEEIMPDETVLEGFIANNDSQTVWSDAELINREQYQIRDFPANMTISDRTNGTGVRYHSMNLIFQGKLGTAMVVMNQPLSQWNDDTVTQFVESIR